MLKTIKLTTLLLSLFVTTTLLAKPKLTFFSYSPTYELEKIYADTSILQQLKDLDASVCIAMHDLSPVRAKVIEVLNAWNIPVKAQLMLNKADRYRLTMMNAELAEKRYMEVATWIAENDLFLEGIGIAIEPMLEDIQQLNEARISLAVKAYKRLNEAETLENAKRTYQNLIKQMESDGYQVESYIYPFTLDEANQGKAFQQLTGLLDLEVDRKIPLFYSSYFEGDVGPSFIVSYGKDTDLAAMAIGSTGGELEMDNVEAPSPLNWAYLLRDMSLASKYTDDLYIFSLEGCIENGFLEKLSALDWELDKSLTSKYQTAEADKIRANMRSVTKGLAYPTVIVVGLALVILLTIIAIWRVLQRVLS